MTGWIFNASPLILLGKINQLHLIKALSPTFRVPRPVLKEVGAGTHDDPELKWLRSEVGTRHFVDPPTTPAFLAQWDLGAGETAVLSIALTEQGAVVVLDDLAARKFAMTFQLPLLGTLGLLIRAKRAGLIKQLLPQVEGLQAAGANLSQSVMTHALIAADEAP